MKELSSAEQAKGVRAALLRLQEQARAALSQREAAGATVELDQSRQGRLSRMDALQAQAMEQAAASRARGDLRRIAAALQRLEAQEYGDCIDCGEPIAAARLQADPLAERCVPCASLREQSG